MKLVRPGPAAGALAALHVPAAPATARLMGAAELIAGSAALVVGGRAAALVVGGFYVVFAGFVAAAMSGRVQVASCGCFGREDAPPGMTHLVIDLVAAAVCLTAAIASPPPGIARHRRHAAVGRDPIPRLPPDGGGGSGDGDDGTPPPQCGPGWSVSVRLVDAGSRFLASRTSRRGFLRNAALVGSALATAPMAYALRPVTAYSAICSCSGSSCDCSALCCDGYTEFCCTLYGSNSCPPGTLAAGWWKADVSGFCVEDGVDLPRYYIDCNVDNCGSCGCGSSGSCGSGCVGLCDCGCGAGILRQPQGVLRRLPLWPVQPGRRLRGPDRVPGGDLHPTMGDRRLVHDDGRHRQQHPLPRPALPACSSPA